MKLTAYDKGAKPDPSKLAASARRVKHVDSAYEEPKTSRKSHPDPNSARQKCLRAGLDGYAVARYRYRNPETTMSVDEIIVHLLERRKQKSIAQRAREHGMSADTLRHRLYRGMSMAEALSVPIDERYARRGSE